MVPARHPPLVRERLEGGPGTPAMTSSSRNERPDWGYLAREAALILLLGYGLLVGGTYNGVVLARIQRINTLLLGLIGAVWLGVRIVRREPFPRTSVDLPLLGFLLAHGLAAALSIDPRRSAGGVWRLGLYVLAFYVFIDLLRRGWPAELFVKVLLIVGAVALGFSLLHVALWYASWLDTSGSASLLPPTMVRAGSVIGGPNVLAAFVNLIWPFAMLRLIEAESWPERLLFLIWLMVAGVVVFFTASRGGWLGTMGALTTVITLSQGLRERLRSLLHWAKARRGHSAAGALAALAALALIVTLAVWQVPRVLNRKGLASRLHFWRAAGVALRTSPFSGTGPLTYGETYLTTHAVPPDRLYVHAHSYPANLAAETGLVGLGALAWLTVTISGSLRRSWRHASVAQQPLFAATLGGLVGCAVHSLFDTVQRLPFISLILALQLAFLLAPRQPRRRSARGLRWALPVGWILLLGVATWSTVTSTLFSRGITTTSTGQWQEGSTLLALAEARDPHHAYYHLQSGYARGLLAKQEPDCLSQAIASYEGGVRRSPNYAPNWINLGALYRQAGEREEALTCMDQARELAPSWAAVHLNLGQLLEELGREDEAAHHHQRALDAVPSWAHAYYWRVTPARSEARDAWLEAESARESASASGAGEAELWYRTGRRAMEAGDHAKALEAFGHALDLKPLVRFYVAKATASSALGRDDEAERLLQTALVSGGGGKVEQVRAKFALAQLYHRQGQSEKAIDTAHRAIETARDPATHLPIRPGHIVYAYYLFHAPTVPEALLPQVTLIRITDEVAGWMLELGSWYQEEGDVDEAARLYRELLEEVPDADEARARLEAMGTTGPN